MSSSLVPPAGGVLCFLVGCLLVLIVDNVKSFNGISAKGFENIDTSTVDEDKVKNLGSVISNGAERFWAKRGMIDPSRKTRGFGRINK